MNGSRVLSVAVALVLLMALSAMAGGADQEQMKARFKSRIEKQMANGGEDVVATSAALLYQAYKENEIAADAKYKGKWLQVEGRVDHVAKDFAGRPYLTLAADQYGVAQVRIELFDVQVKEIIKPKEFTVCTDVDKLMTLKKGQKVALEGLGGGAVMSFPLVKSAILFDPKMVQQ